MEYLRIESTKFTPGVILDPSHNVLEFYGFSLPEDAIEFYEPILDWLSSFKTTLENQAGEHKEINVIFKLVYFNSASLRQIMDIFNILSQIYHAGIPIQITWQYDSEDSSMADSGNEFGDISKIPVTLVAYN